MDNNKQLHIQLRKKTILKWYEYVMSNPEENIKDDITEHMVEEIGERIEAEGLTSDEEIAARYGDEVVDLATTGLSEDEQALVADIMARFEQVKSAQANVDNLFSESSSSDEDLISSICAPKQNNVDDLVKKAYDTM